MALLAKDPNQSIDTHHFGRGPFFMNSAGQSHNNGQWFDQFLAHSLQFIYTIWACIINIVVVVIIILLHLVHLPSSSAAKATGAAATVSNYFICHTRMYRDSQFTLGALPQPSKCLELLFSPSRAPHSHSLSLSLSSARRFYVRVTVWNSCQIFS